MLVRDPVVRPALVVHAIEEPRQRGQRGGLRESAVAAATTSTRSPGVLGERRILARVFRQLEPRAVHAAQRAAAADPAAVDRSRSAALMRGPSTAATISAAMSSHERARSAAPTGATRVAPGVGRVARQARSDVASASARGGLG